MGTSRPWLTADEFEDRTGRALAARTWGELRDLMQDLPTSPAGPHVPVTATTGAPPQRSPGRTVLVPIAALAGIGIAVAMSAGTAHARWGILWLLLPVLLIARRMTCCAWRTQALRAQALTRRQRRRPAYRGAPGRRRFHHVP